MTSFKVGDVVRLKSGGPLMTVTSVGSRYEGSEVEAWCTWFKSGNETTTEVFPFPSLKAEGAG